MVASDENRYAIRGVDRKKACSSGVRFRSPHSFRASSCMGPMTVRRRLVRQASIARTILLTWSRFPSRIRKGTLRSLTSSTWAGRLTSSRARGIPQRRRRWASGSGVFRSPRGARAPRRVRVHYSLRPAIVAGHEKPPARVLVKPAHGKAQAVEPGQDTEGHPRPSRGTQKRKEGRSLVPAFRRKAQRAIRSATRRRRSRG